MSITVAKYTFSSWLRKGIGATINQTDNLGAGTSSTVERSTVPIDIKLNAVNIHQDFSLIGPGDIIGINNNMIVRSEPLNWITNFEPNYLAFIEFYDEDFLWRYTPAKASGDKLRPWLLLLVLKDNDKEEEKEFKKDEKKLPLPTVTVKSATSLPSSTQSWAWAHVHVNEGYNSTTEFEEFLTTLHNLNNPNADKIISRLMSPRKLQENTAYRAFLVPAFETGRMAGLGQNTSSIDAQLPSWSETTANLEFPYYHEWYFRTGENEDFESLVKLLEPRVIDKKVGIRDMDGSAPGFGMSTGTDLGLILPASQLQNIVGIEGALKAPTSESRPKNIDTTKPFFSELQEILNFPANLEKNSNTSIDPVVSPPIYGENHAIHHELDKDNSGWLHALNKDPRNRVPAGFGTNVIQKNQESYVAKAWTQVQRILDTNKKILYTSFALNFSEAVKSNFINKLKPEKTLLFFSPLLKKVKGSPTTLYFQMQQSNIPTAAVSTALRRMLRPRGAFHKKLNQADQNFSHSSLLTEMNSGKITAAPPKQVPEGILRIDKVTDSFPVNQLLNLLFKYRLWLLILFLIGLLVAAIISGYWIFCAGIAAVAIGAYFYSEKWEKKIENPEVLNSPKTVVDRIQQVEPRSNFTFTETDPLITLPATSSTEVTVTTTTTSSTPEAATFSTVSYSTSSAPGTDSMGAEKFRKAALDLSKRLTIEAPKKQFSSFNILNAYEKLLTATDPKIAFPKQLASLVYFSFNPEWLLRWEHLIPAMAYPDFEDPMYEKLRDISTELLIPNLDLIPQNTISLLVTNPPFIESYMVGLNHEFGKELLWREFPTDTRGSYFRQFWDVKGIVAPETGLTQFQITEKYKDIKPLDKWQSFSPLGGHNNRNLGNKKQVVLVVRGELLKKYPNTIIYAQKAHIFKNASGVPEAGKEPKIIEVKTEAEMKEEIKFPLFKAEILPDIKFFGFDLTIDQAKGDESPQSEASDWGWYFIIQQIPGEPRFGMDVYYEDDKDPSTPVTWDDLSWDKFDPSIKFIKTDSAPGSFTPAGTGESISQWGRNSADMANILYQKPVMIAIHAKEMLESLSN